MGSIEGRGAGKIPQDPTLDNLMKQLFAEAGPARKLEFQQLTEALQSGGVGARIPIIQRAVEAAMGAGAQNETLGRTATARAGLAGTPFDVASQIGTHTGTTAAVAGIGPAIASQLIGQGPAMVSNATAQGISIAGQELQRQEFNSNQIGRFYEDLKQSLEFAGTSGKAGGSSDAQPSPTINYAQIGYGDPSTFNPSGPQFQE